MDTGLRNTSEIINKYLNEVSQKYSQTQSSEYGYRTPFENLLKDIFSEIKVNQIDHDAKAVGGNKPDFVLSKSGIPILFIEVKDIGVSLDKIENSEQLARYYGYDNLVLTDYLEFRFYRNGLKYVEPISIATYDKNNRTITPIPGNFELLKKTLLDFPLSHKEPIKSGSHLAKIMGGKAYRIRENAKDMLSSSDKENKSIYKVYETMKRQLIHDMTPDSFADMYAQTLVYGLFVARFHDKTPDSFTRSEARDLVPASNPLLRHFFDHIAGSDFDKRLDHIVDELCDVFSHSDISKLINNYYGTEKDSKDPVIHFYEDFLQEYDSKKRKEFGAYYTPLPIVQFIVKSVDYILEHDFKLVGGLANSSKNEKGHIVQVLDPATGTGTFLTEIIKLIHERRKNQQGNWGSYVLHEILPRLFGFEIMIAPYTIAHLKMSMLLKETGFKYFNNRRLGIYLTNSLQEGNTIEDLFGGFGLAESISQESKEATVIKNEKPIMVVLGNPPYSISSQNKGDWIKNLMLEYKRGLHEKNIQPLSDDYIKFIRFAEHFIEKNKTGIVAMITNNSYINGIIHRQMRKHLSNTFDDIYILDLHGNTKKKEVCPNGSKDENVFDIQQGVSINIFVRKSIDSNETSNIYHSEIFGTRLKKFEILNNGFRSINWKHLPASEENNFVPQNNKLANEYKDNSFSIIDMFKVNSSGVTTSDDRNLVSYTQFQENNEKYLYKPFDSRYINYDLKLVNRHRFAVMKHFINNKNNLGLVLMRKQVNSRDFSTILVTKSIIDKNLYGFQTSVFPLFITDSDKKITENLNKEIISIIENRIGKVEAESIFRYIYAILHNPTYKSRYNEFLKIDFPRVPYPKDRKTFDKLVKLGNELIQYHLLEHQNIDPYQISYLGEGDNIVEKPEYKDGKIYINPTQYFGNVSEVAWNFYIGGYQPAQKWLKDRKGRELNNDDIEHYSKIVIVLKETDRLMKEIDKIKMD